MSGARVAHAFGVGLAAGKRQRRCSYQRHARSSSSVRGTSPVRRQRAKAPLADSVHDSPISRRGTSRRTWRSRSTRRSRAVDRSLRSSLFGSATRTSHYSDDARAAAAPHLGNDSPHGPAAGLRGRLAIGAFTLRCLKWPDLAGASRRNPPSGVRGAGRTIYEDAGARRSLRPFTHPGDTATVAW